MRLPKFLSSKKLWTALATAGVVIANRKLNLDMTPQDIGTVAGIASAYIVGQGIADHGASVAGNKKE